MSSECSGWAAEAEALRVSCAGRVIRCLHWLHVSSSCRWQLAPAIVSRRGSDLADWNRWLRVARPALSLRVARTALCTRRGARGSEPSNEAESAVATDATSSGTHFIAAMIRRFREREHALARVQRILSPIWRVNIISLLSIGYWEFMCVSNCILHYYNESHLTMNSNYFLFSFRSHS